MFTQRSPIYEYIYKLDLLFEYDSDINPIYYINDSILDIYTNSAKKAQALIALLPQKIEIGNEVVDVNIMGVNPSKEPIAPLVLYRNLFYNNNLIYNIITNELDELQIIFKPLFAQAPLDAHYFKGIKTYLYQDIAKEIVKPHPSVYFCTAPVT